MLISLFMRSDVVSIGICVAAFASQIVIGVVYNSFFEMGFLAFVAVIALGMSLVICWPWSN